MNKLGLVTDSCFEEHDTGPGHPESPERLKRIREHLETTGLADRSVSMPLAAADEAMLERVHASEYIAHVRRACERGDRFLDSEDTAICPASDRIARVAAGSLSALALAVATRELDCGFAAVRPPGHHAEHGLAMGFCLYNNVAVAARAVQQRSGVERVLIVDWDVHHGNGTQHIFDEDPTVFYYSLHQSPLYPGTGARGEVGIGAGEGTTLNTPLPPGAGDDAFLGALRDDLTPAARRFAPDFVFVSAGFDAHRRDPLANLEVTTEAYAEATRIVAAVADETAGGRLVSVLEGGYDLTALTRSTAAHLEVLLAGKQRPKSARPS